VSRCKICHRVEGSADWRVGRWSNNWDGKSGDWRVGRSSMFFPQGWRVGRLKDCENKKILRQGWKVIRLEGWEEKQVLLQGWRVNRLAGWEKKQVLPQCSRVVEGCEEMQNLSQI